MSVAVTLDPGLTELGKVLGVLDELGEVDPAWFSDPVAITVERVSEDGLGALAAALDAFLEPVPVPGAPPGERWYSVAEEEGVGSVYITLDGAADVLGVGVRAATPDGETPGGAIELALPLLHLPASGTPAPPPNAYLRGSVTADLGWSHDADHAVGLEAARLSLRIPLPGAPGAPELDLLLRGLDTGGGAQPDLVIDADHLDAAVLELVVQTLSAVLDAAGAPTADADVAGHIAGLLGLGTPQPLPLAGMLEDPAEARSWLDGLVRDPARLGPWISHLAGLVGRTATASGSGRWRIPLASRGPTASIDLVVATAADHLALAIEAGARAAAAGGISVTAAAQVLRLPLVPNQPVDFLATLDLLVRAPTGGGKLVETAQLEVGALRAGLRLSASAVVPLLELDDVVMGGDEYPRIDLSSADSVAASVGNVSQSLLDALGVDPAVQGAGRRLGVLAGLVAPTGAPSGRSSHRHRCAGQ